MVFGVALALRLSVPAGTGGWRGLSSYDAGVYYASGAALVHGWVPYRDFILLHPPGVALVTAPLAWVGSLTSDPTGFAAAAASFSAVGAVNAALVVAVSRRLGLGRVPSLVGGGFYAVWFVTVHAEFESRLEPLANLALLLGLLWFASIRDDRRGRRAAVLCGAALGAAVCVKVWYVVPLLVLVAWLVGDRRAWAAARAALGAVGAISVICLPFFVLAPREMWAMVVSWQVGRTPSNGLRELLFFEQLPDEVSSWALAWAINATSAAIAAFLVVLARSVPAARPLVVLMLVQAAVVLAAPSFFIFYLAYLAPALALCVAAATTWRPDPATLPPSTAALWRRRAAVGTAALVAVAVLAAPAMLLWHGRGGTEVEPLPPTSLVAAVADLDCVVSDSPAGLIALDALSRNLANRCPNWIDVTGRTYAPDMHLEGPEGRPLPRDANPRWLQALHTYLLSGDAVIIRRTDDTGMHPSTWAAIREGGVLAAERGYVVYRTSEPGAGAGERGSRAHVSSELSHTSEH